MLLQILDCAALMLYSDLSPPSLTTERYRLWYRIEHYESSEEDHTHEQTAGLGHRDTDDRSSGGRLQRQRTDDLPSDPEWQAHLKTIRPALAGYVLQEDAA